jgi:hypothetical protein
VLYTYWNSDSPPQYIVDCLRTWRRHLPDYRVQLITPSNSKEFVDVDVASLPWNDSPQRESDIVRVSTLRRLGGVWMDASTILLARPAVFDAIERGQHQFVGYYIARRTTTPKFPVFESWFFATAPQGPFVTAWHKHFFGIAPGQSVSTRVAQLAARVNVQRIGNLHYHLVHLCAQAAMQLSAPDTTADCLFLLAEDGPLAYLYDHGWDGKRSAAFLGALLAARCPPLKRASRQNTPTISDQGSTSSDADTRAAQIDARHVMLKVTSGVREFLTPAQWQTMMAQASDCNTDISSADE